MNLVDIFSRHVRKKHTLCFMLNSIDKSGEGNSLNFDAESRQKKAEEIVK